MRASSSLLWAALMLTACDGTPATTLTHAQPGTAPAVANLSPSARDELAGSIDLAAMDHLLLTLSQTDQQQFLSTFDDVELVANGRSAPSGETTHVSFIVQFSDPEQQMLLDRTWAPFWQQLPRSVLRDPTFPLPGRAIAARDTVSGPGTKGRGP